MQKKNAAAVMRMILTAVYTAAAVLLQCSVFPHLRLFGAIPELTLCVIVCVSCWEDEKFSCILAVCAGFLLDTVGSDKFTLSPLMFLLSACVSILLAKRVFAGKLIPAVISGGAALAAGAVKTTLILAAKGAPVNAAILHTALPQLLYGAIVFIPVFLLSVLHFRIFRNSFDLGRLRAGARA